MIDKLKLHNTFIHKEKEIEFSQGVNAIIGENRKGKSSICEAISYAYFGKLNKSTIDKIINDDEEEATVTITDSNLPKPFTRQRKKGTSHLKAIKGNDLNSNVNISFKEYTDMFYLSANEDYSLFDAAYLRNFLVSIFDLEKYKHTYDKLRIEANIIKECRDKAGNYKEVNKAAYKAKFDEIKEAYLNIKEQQAKLKTKIKTQQNKKIEIYSKSRELEMILKAIDNKKELITQDKCPTCKRAFSSSQQDKALDTLTTKYKLKETQLITYAQELERLSIIINKLETVNNKVNEKITKYYGALQKIKYILEQKKPEYNQARLKELEHIMPVFTYTGFPTYMLQKYVPTIQLIANNLVKTVFEDLSLNITTQTERNTLALRVEVYKGKYKMNLKDCCGSETVLINICLRLAVIAMYKQIKKTSIDFLVIDEGIERLDDTIALNIIDLFNQFIGMGYINQVIMVTHKTVLKNLNTVDYIEL